MTGISIDSIATMLPIGRMPPAGAAKGRFAGLIADLTAHMAVATVADGELPVGVVLPGDRQDLAGDADTTGPMIDIGTDDDDDDALPIGLIAIAPAMPPVPALAASWKMPTILTVPPVAAAIVPAVSQPTTDTPPDAAAPVIADIVPMPAKPIVADGSASVVTAPVMPAAPGTPAAPTAAAIPAAPAKPEQPLVAATALPRIDPPVATADAPAKAEPAVVTAPVVTPAVTPPAHRPVVAATPAMPVVPLPAADPAAPVADKPLPEGIAIAAVAHDRAAHREPGPVIANRAPVPPPMIAPVAIAAQMADRGTSDDHPGSPAIAAVDAIAAAGPAPLAAPIVTRPVAVAVLPQAVDTGRAEWIETLVDRIDELRGQSGQRETRIRLLPDALGIVDIRIQRDGDRVHVHFATDNPHARALLNEAAPRLVDMAEARGLKLGDTGVRQDSGAQAQSGQAQSGQSNPGQPRSDQSRHAAFRPADSQTDAAPDESDARIA